MLPNDLMLILAGSAISSLIGLLFWLIKSKIEQPENRKKELADKVQDFSHQVDTLSKNLMVAEAKETILRSEIQNITTQYLEAAKLVAKLSDEVETLRHIVEELRQKINSLESHEMDKWKQGNDKS